MSFQDLVTLLPIQLLADVPRIAAEDGQSPWAPATHVGDPDEAPGSLLQLGTLLAVEAFWGVNQ